MKKTISVLLTALMLISLFAVFPFASSAGDDVFINFGAKWEYVAYEEDPEIGLVAQAPEGWLDGTDSEAWTKATAPIGTPQWSISASKFPYQYYSAFLRKSFTIEDLSKVTSLMLYIKYDEDPTVYLNGTEVWSADGYIDSRYVEVSLDEYLDLLKEGENTLQVAISNVNGGGVLDAALICIDSFEALIPEASTWEMLHYERTDAENPTPETAAPDGWLNRTDSEEWTDVKLPVSGTLYTSGLANTVLAFNYHDTYLRTTFTVEDPTAVSTLLLKVIYDEDPVIYLNGVEIFSATGYKDSGYQVFSLNGKTNLIQEGENTVCVYFCNKINGGGTVFDMALYAGSDIQYYDENGYIVPVGASCTNVYSFGALNAPENILDGDQDTVCGSTMTDKKQTVTIHFRRPEEVTEVFIQCKDEGTTTNADGSRGTYDIYAVYGGEEYLIAENVPAMTGTDGGYTVKLDKAMPAEGVKVVITSWQGSNWACVADLFAKATGNIPEAPMYTTEGFILNMTASCVGFADFGAFNAPVNVLDGNEDTVCGSGYNKDVEQSVTVTFPRAEMVSEIFLQCKNEGPVETAGEELEEIYADGTRGTYAVYLINGGKETLVAENVPAVTGYRGGYTIELDQAQKAEAVKVVITSWHGGAWACVADIAVKSEGPASQTTFDVNNDGVINISDVTFILDYLSSSTEYKSVYDVNGDGSVTISDVTVLLDYLSGANK